jgi:hypothetical protein
MHLQLAERIILENGGEKIEVDGKPGYRIIKEEPANVEPLPVPLNRLEEMREHWLPLIQSGLTGSEDQKVVAAYTAVCLGLVEKISQEREDEWNAALDLFAPHYDRLIGRGVWNQKELDYFQEVIQNRNPSARFPGLDY